MEQQVRYKTVIPRRVYPKGVYAPLPRIVWIEALWKNAAEEKYIIRTFKPVRKKLV